jgi:hypothetical protein
MLGISIASSAGAQVWKPYSFGGNEHYKYMIESSKDGEKKSGSIDLDFEKVGEDKYKVSYESKLGENESSSTTTATADELAGKLMMTMMMSGSEAGAILGSTLFTPALSMMFLGMSELEVGSGFTRTEGGKKVSFKVESKETIAGVEGFRCVFREDDKIKYLQVIAPDVALPLHTEVVDDDGSRFTTKLVEYTKK